MKTCLKSISFDLINIPISFEEHINSNQFAWYSRNFLRSTQLSVEKQKESMQYTYKRTQDITRGEEFVGKKEKEQEKYIDKTEVNAAR